MSRKDVVVAFRIPRTLKALLEAYAKANMHMSPSEVVRESIRAKLKDEVPGLYAKFVREASNEQGKQKAATTQ